MITVRTICSDEHLHDVEATVFGQWASHRGLRKPDCGPLDFFVVTLVPSGSCIHSVTGPLSESASIALAELLHQTIPHIDNWRDIPVDVAMLIKEMATLASCGGRQ